MQVALGSGYAVSRSGRSIGAFGQQDAHVFDASNGNFLRSFEVNSGILSVSDWDSDALSINAGRLLVGAPGGTGHTQNDSQLFDLETGQLQQTFVAPSDAERFGFATALDGNIALIGDPYMDRVHVFDTLSGEQLAMMEPEGGSMPLRSLRFGHDVSISGGMAAVSDLSRNAVYLFDSETWQLEQVIEPENPLGNRWFGTALELDGDTLAVGAFSLSSFGVHSGSAFVYDLATGENVRLTTEDITVVNGFDIDISGNRIALGSVRRHSNAAFRVGDVSLFVRETGTLLGEINRPRGLAVSHWGWAVDIESDTILVGDRTASFRDENDFYQNAGSMYLLRIPEPTTLTLAQCVSVVCILGCWRGTNRELRNGDTLSI